MAVSYMTKDGYDKILAEINYLETVKRPEISAQIAEARDKGDLSENAEYDAAKEAQGIMEAKLSQLKGLISNARLIDETRVQTDEVQILNKVKIKNTKNNAVMTYTLVSDSEANLKEGKIAVSTPIGKGLLGKKVGDIAETVLLPGDPLRAKYIAETFLENPVCYNNVRGMMGFTGTYKGKRVSIQGTGMGVPSIGIYVNELITEYGCKNLIRIGTAGSMQENVKLKI